MRDNKKWKQCVPSTLKVTYITAENRYRKPPKKKEKSQDVSTTRTTSNPSLPRQEQPVENVINCSAAIVFSHKNGRSASIGIRKANKKISLKQKRKNR